jgi:hypothetical protein
MTNTIYVICHQQNIADVDGCESSAAVDAIEGAARAKLEAWAAAAGYAVDWRSENDRDTRTFVVGAPDELGARGEADVYEMLNDAADKAISDGDWEDA